MIRDSVREPPQCKSTERGREQPVMRTDGIRTGYDTRGTGRLQSGGKIGRRLVGQEQNLRPSSDHFMHTEQDLSPYTDYDAFGNYKMEGSRVLPDRYYKPEISGSVYYKGGTVTCIELLEEAVVTGAVTLDETRDVWHNIHNAERELIDKRAKPLYPWSSTLYSEDGQYRFRVENGQITGSTRAFYETADGRKITAQYLAEQLASGVLPGDLDGDWSFLAHLDSELYDKALLMGRAARNFRTIDEQYKAKQIPEDKYLDDISMYLMYFLGRADGMRSAVKLRIMLTDPEFGKKALSGRLTQADQAQVHRQNGTFAQPSASDWLKSRTRRRIGQDPE